MTEIASAKETNVYSDSGKTSPLSELPTSSPSLLHSKSLKNKSMTTDTEGNDISSNANNNGATEALSPEKDRSRSIISDESSDLSDLDSEAETEKMYSGGESKLKKLAKVEENYEEDTTHELADEDETTLQPNHGDDEEDDENRENDKFIKDEVIDELSNGNNGEEIKTPSEDIGAVVENLKKEQLETNGKRKLDESSEHPSSDIKNGINESSKRQKLQTDEEDLEEQEEQEDLEIEEGKEEQGDEEGDEEVQGSDLKSKVELNGEKETILNESNNAHGDELDEAEDEDEDEDEENDVAAEEVEEEEEEEELTEEQKQQRQKDLELELERQKERKEALDFLTEIEVDFAKLRDRLYEDKMERFKSELAMCLNGAHPELQTVYTKIDLHREEKTKLAELERKYKLESITKKTIAQRTQVHQQFYKLVFDAKNKLLKEITEEWYKINKERRTMDLLVPEYSYKVPEYTDELVYQRQQLNEEISLLVGLNRYYGFPAAPQLKAVEGEELDDDLRAMNIPL